MNTPLPLRLGDARDFLRVRNFFQEVQYDEPTLCKILKVDEICDILKSEAESLEITSTQSPALITLCKLMLTMQPIGVEEGYACFPEEVIDSLIALDLLRKTSVSRDTTLVESFFCPVWVYPAQGFWIASDQTKVLNDAVFPAISPLTYAFLKHVALTPVNDALDLCAGTGVGAMVMSRQARRTVASDVSTRAAHFARFNCLLNGCENVEVIESSYYAALEGRTFDRIIAHPPYVPSLSNAIVWRDGGETGEGPLQQIVTGLPAHLCKGGTFFASCAGFDTKEQSFEGRVRNWLGETQSEFDVIFAVHRDISPKELALELGEISDDFEPSDIFRLQEAFGQLGARRHVKGMLVIHRRIAASGSSCMTQRKKLSRFSNGDSFEWLLRWSHWQQAEEAALLFPQLKPRLSSNLRVRVTHVVEDRSLVPADFILASGTPFLAETRVDPEIVQVLLQSDGAHTLTEVFEVARSSRLVPEGYTLDQFLEFARMMIDRGYLELDFV